MGKDRKQRQCRLCGNLFTVRGHSRPAFCYNITHFYNCPICGKKIIVHSTHSLSVPQKNLIKNKSFKLNWVNNKQVEIIWLLNEIWDGACLNCRKENINTIKKITQQRREDTNFNNYGYKNVMQAVSVKKKFRETCEKNLGVDNPSKATSVKNKKRETCLKHFGVDNPLKSDEIKKRVQVTNKKLYGYNWGLQSEEVKRKSRITCKNKYGKEYISQTNSFKNKLRESLMRKYGVTCVLNVPEIRRKTIDTLFKNGKRSSLERYILMRLKELGAVEHEDFEQEYKSDRYPFYCDFYFPKTDTFLEINGFWTHGGHWFDENDKVDVEKLNKWEEKAKENKFYKIAVKTWIVSDPKKHEIALENDLNYIVLWNKADVENFCVEKLESLF